MNVKPLLDLILDQYTLSLTGDHGLSHWARVLTNGTRLAEGTGGRIDVVTLFAVLHDSRRIRETGDPDHGPRAADFARELRGKAFDLDDPGFQLLTRACEGHTRERTHPDITIQTCWDADRLDIGRVGIPPHPSRLCTELAKTPEMIKWADGRACMGFVPEFISTEWGLDL